MNHFFSSAFKNLGFKATSPSQMPSYRRGSRTGFKDVDLKLNIERSSDDSSFVQWKDAMKMVARLPDGIPPEFRKQLWMALANRYMENKNIDFEKVLCSCFNEKNNPDDSELGTQIIKDLHRTGCSLFSGDVAEQNQGHLKRVLLAYARWNVNVGYCQGFNMLAAIILEVVGWVERDALKVMIFLIEGVLPESYFANHLRGLSVDMAVFRDLLRMRLCSLSQHLDKLQANARDSSTGYCYEPPLTNVFTMQWFLTLFSNCLPKDTVLRVWDLIFLEGNEVLLRTALAIWDGLADRIMAVESADEFYCIMGVLTREILEFGLMDANTLLKTICTLAPFPFPQLHELRDSYTYNIQPFTSSWSSSRQFHIFSGEADDDENEEDMVAATWCLSNELHMSRKKGPTNSVTPSSAFNSIGPGAFGSSEGSNFSLSFTNFNTERMTLDISALKRQYSKLRERQKQAHVILSGAFQGQFKNRSHSSLAVNHLLLGKRPLTRRKSFQGHLKFAEKTSTSQKYGCGENLCDVNNKQSLCDTKSLQNPNSATSEVKNSAGTVKSISKVSEGGDTVIHDTSSIQESDSDSSEDSKVELCENRATVLQAKMTDASISRKCSKAADHSYVNEDLCYCDITDNCSDPISSEPDAPSPINPFPTKRRVGSVNQIKRHSNFPVKDATKANI